MEDRISKRRQLAIVGNMNVGKTSLFSKLCGNAVESLNVPGSTVTIKRGSSKTGQIRFVDTPGIYSIFSAGQDERASRDILIDRDAIGEIDGIILVADAKNMKRSISVALQFAEYELPMLLCVNMIDEASSRGIEIDYDKLSDLLGINVVPTIARDGIGVDTVNYNLDKLKVPWHKIQHPTKIEEFISLVDKLLSSARFSSRITGLLLLAQDQGEERIIEEKFGSGMLSQLKSLAKQYHQEEASDFASLLSNLYSKRADEIVRQTTTVDPPATSSLLIRFGDWCTKLSTGIPIAAGMVILMYFFVGSFGATYLVDKINGVLFNAYLIPWVDALVAPLPSAFLRDMIIDPEFGVLPTGVFLALGLVLPVIFCFYIAFGLLEDSGYLPRLSFLLDRIFQKMGLNGRGVIPLVMGFSCVTMALLTTRMLNSEKEKNIASFLVFLCMPCAPLIAVMLVILDKLPISATITVYGLLLLQILVSGMLADKILPGVRTPLIIEIPPMRLPKPLTLLKMASLKTYFFMKEALPVFILASLGVFLFERAGGLVFIERVTDPVVSSLLGLPEKSVQVFIKTMVRRESGAAELARLAGEYSNLQIVVNLLVMTLVAPCLNATIILFKERGSRVGAVIFATTLAYALIFGGIFNHICHFFHISFT